MTDRNPSEFEQRLRRAMQPVEPPADFAGNVMAALRRARERSGANAPSTPRARSDHSAGRLPWRRRRPAWSSAVAAAAALAAVLIGAGLWNQQRTQELRARQARAQVLEALSISSRTFNAALHVSVNPTRSG
jgi:hypothetical protein